MRASGRDYAGNAFAALATRAARAAAFGTLLCFVAASVCAGAQFPVPPTPQRYVTDASNALSNSTIEEVEVKLGSFERATGHQIVVYVAPSTGGVPLETYTAQTAQTWRIGRKGKDDGAVLFLFTKDRKVRIEVGYGLEGSLTDAQSSQIINDKMVPLLRANDLDGAVNAGVDGMLAAIDPQAAQSLPPAERSEEPSGRGPDVGLIVFLAFLAIVGLTILMQAIAWGRYGILCASEGKLAATQDMRRSWLNAFWSSALLNAEIQVAAVALSSGGRGSSGGGGGFSAGGGSFGGGGASGSW